MKFAEAIGALLFNGNGWANTSLIQSDPCLRSLLQIISEISNGTHEGNKDYIQFLLKEYFALIKQMKT